MHSFARSVTNPRSPGPAPTRKHFPIFFLSAIDLLYQFDRERFRHAPDFHARFHLRRVRDSGSNISARKYHCRCIDGRQHPNRRIAISVQEA